MFTLWAQFWFLCAASLFEKLLYKNLVFRVKRSAIFCGHFRPERLRGLVGCDVCEVRFSKLEVLDYGK